MENKHDYEEPIIGCSGIRGEEITEGETACYTQVINNDMILEKTEYARLKLKVWDSTALTEVKRGYDRTTIEIFDDEGWSLLDHCGGGRGGY